MSCHRVRIFERAAIAEDTIGVTVLSSQPGLVSGGIYMDVPHSANPKPSWFGESVGHYDGDTLVVDTVGLNTKTFVDNYRTPHTEKLHGAERFRMIDGGKTLEVSITVEDADAFNLPWSARQRFSKVVNRGPLIEEPCAENNLTYFGYDVLPVPQADKPDF